MQLANGGDRRRWLSLLWLGGRPGETLLSDALQIGVSAGSQKQGCCGRLMLGRERKPASSDIRPPMNFPFQKPWDDSSINDNAVALAACSTGGQSRHRSAHHKELDLSAIVSSGRTLLYEKHERSLVFKVSSGSLCTHWHVVNRAGFPGGRFV